MYRSAPATFRGPQIMLLLINHLILLRYLEETQVGLSCTPQLVSFNTKSSCKTPEWKRAYMCVSFSLDKLALS